MQDQKLDDLLSHQTENLLLQEGLKLLWPRPTAGSLAAYDELNFEEMHRFMRSFRLDIDETITGSEPFPGEVMKPTRFDVILPEEICEHLVQYYKDAYNLDFVSFTKYISNRQINQRNPNQPIIIQPRANQFGRIRIGSEIFGSVISPRHKKNSCILANFIQENEMIEAYPGQVQFFFEHTVKLPSGYHTHRLAFVKWYLPAEDQQKRFHCRINDDNSSCNVELWKYDFYGIGRDSIIPVHNIYARFIDIDFTIGKRNPVKYMAVVPINRHFHI
jgi:hypothetical protein